MKFKLTEAQVKKVKEAIEKALFEIAEYDETEKVTDKDGLQESFINQIVEFFDGESNALGPHAELDFEELNELFEEFFEEKDEDEED